jgi:hypothetical protein
MTSLIFKLNDPLIGGVGWHCLCRSAGRSWRGWRRRGGRAEIRSYKGLMVAEKMTSNRQIASAGKSMQEMEDEFV